MTERITMEAERLLALAAAEAGRRGHLLAPGDGWSTSITIDGDERVAAWRISITPVGERQA